MTLPTRLRTPAVLLATAAVVALTALVAPPQRATAGVTFSIGFTGDHGSGSDAMTVFRQVGADSLAFFQSLGDLSYGAVTPDTWCQQVKDSINAGAGHPQGDPYGETFPVALVEGNHDVADLDRFVASGCLPDRLGAVPSPAGTYGREYYIDYPPGSPLARFILTAPDTSYTYTPGSAHYQWLSDTIDSARTAGIKWVVVGSHKNYMSTGQKVDEIGSDFFNLLVAKKVDLIVQGHDHTYQRSKQLAHSPGCPLVPTEPAVLSCVVNDGASGQYAAGAGSVLVITGTGGHGLYDVSATDPGAPYFSRIMGSGPNGTYGYTKLTIGETGIRATFRASAGAGFSDSFSIGAPPLDTQPPTAPTGLTAQLPAATEVELTWTAARDDQGVAGYHVLRDGAQVATTDVARYRDTTVTADTTYVYTVRAFDAAGNVGPESAAVTVTTPSATLLVPVAEDATIKKDFPNTNFGATSTVKADASPVQDFLLKFAVTGVAGRAVTSARLRLYVTNGSTNGGDLRRIADTWSQGSVTWQTAPTAEPTLVASLGPATVDSWSEVDVTSLVSGDGVHSLRVSSTFSDGAGYTSAEGGSNRPQLVLQLGGTVDTVPPITAATPAGRLPVE